METKEIMERVVSMLRGKTAIVQIIVDGECHLRRLGDANELIDHPELIAPSSTVSFLSWMEEQIAVAPVSEATRGNHRNCLSHLRGFNPKLTMGDMTSQTVYDFDRHLRLLKLSTNTIAKLMKIWHRYINLAINEDMLLRDPFRKYTIRRETTHKNSLTERELKRIEDNVDTLSEKERVVASAFLFSCYSGLRFSDLCRVRGSDVRQLAGQRWLDMRTQKTGAEVHVPISVAFSGKALALIRGQGKLFDLPNNARANLLLGRVMKKLRIRKHVTMHCGRVTCATICLLRGVPLSTIQHILGHRSIVTTASVYAQVRDNTIMRSMRRAWR